MYNGKASCLPGQSKKGHSRELHGHLPIQAVLQVKVEKCVVSKVHEASNDQNDGGKHVDSHTGASLESIVLLDAEIKKTQPIEDE